MTKEYQWIKEILMNAFSYIHPRLTDYSGFIHGDAELIKIKKLDNIQYSFDVVLDQLFQHALSERHIQGKVFSEESGWLGDENGPYIVIYDPFCNSSLAARGICDAAAGISIFRDDYSLLASGIVDYQNGLIGIFSEGKTSFYQAQTGNTITLAPHVAINNLAESFVALGLEKSQDRVRYHELGLLLATPKRVALASGHIYWLRLAAGHIDGYTDPLNGEPLYEMFACAVAIGTGCTVTDTIGAPFNHAQEIRRFIEDRWQRYHPVAARNEHLHQELLETLTKAPKR